MSLPHGRRSRRKRDPWHGRRPGSPPGAVRRRPARRYRRSRARGRLVLPNPGPRRSSLFQAPGRRHADAGSRNRPPRPQRLRAPRLPQRGRDECHRVGEPPLLQQGGEGEGRGPDPGEVDHGAAAQVIPDEGRHRAAREDEPRMGSHRCTDIDQMGGFSSSIFIVTIGPPIVRSASPERTAGIWPPRIVSPPLAVRGKDDVQADIGEETALGGHIMRQVIQALLAGSPSLSFKTGRRLAMVFLLLRLGVHPP